jgi:hypothetical protein
MTLSTRIFSAGLMTSCTLKGATDINPALDLARREQSEGTPSNDVLPNGMTLRSNGFGS